jgi:hypothetical protein
LNCSENTKEIILFNCNKQVRLKIWLFQFLGQCLAKDTAFHWSLSVPQLLSTFASDPGVSYFSKNFIRYLVQGLNIARDVLPKITVASFLLFLNCVIDYLNFLNFLTIGNDRGSLDRISLDRNCVLSLDRNYVNHLIKFFDTFHLIEICNNDFGQTPKN